MKLCEILECPFVALAIDAADPCNGALGQSRFLQGAAYGALDKAQTCVALAANSKPEHWWVPLASPCMGDGCADLQRWQGTACLSITA